MQLIEKLSVNFILKTETQIITMVHIRLYAKFDIDYIILTLS